MTENVLRKAPCPVLAVRETQPIKQIVIALDGSPLAESVLKPAIEVATLLNAKITLLRVEDVINRVDRWTLDAAAELDRVERGLGQNYLVGHANEAERYVRTLARRIGSGAIEVQAVCLDGNAAKAIVDFAASAGSVLIAMGTHGRAGVRRWIDGSVTETVLRGHTGPILAVKAVDESVLAV